MTIELLTKMIERMLDQKTTGEVVSFTPSIVSGRRFVGFKVQSKEFLIQIDEC